MLQRLLSVTAPPPSQDRRFAGNPLVVDNPHIRFYVAVVDAHGGLIHVDTGPDGTAFALELPLGGRGALAATP